MASCDNFEKPVEQPRNAHTALEDVLAIVIGTLMVSFGVVMLRQVGALTGGTAGMAFLAHYLTQVSFGTAFFIINLPFYYLSVRRMGWQFTLKTFSAVALVSGMWGVATLSGPAVGGLFAQAGQWRLAFGALLPLLVRLSHSSGSSIIPLGWTISLEVSCFTA